MDKYFRTQQGELVNIVEHTLEQLEKWPNLKVYIGSDGQCYGDKTRYATVIVYRYGNRGAHFIYKREEIDRHKTDYMRLYEEGLRTVEAAALLEEEIPIRIEALEFDYAAVKKTISSMLVGAFKYLQNAIFKGGQQIATKAADHVCRHPDIYK